MNDQRSTPIRLVLALLLAGLLLSMVTTTLPVTRPLEYLTCATQGGRWEVLGFSGPGCNYPTGDAGKRCQSSSECEGSCLASVEWSNVPDVAPGDAVGYCSEWRINYSCHVWVEAGAYHPICVD